jgi:hypothetical protein
VVESRKVKVRLSGLKVKMLLLRNSKPFLVDWSIGSAITRLREMMKKRTFYINMRSYMSPVMWIAYMLQLHVTMRAAR